MPSQIVKLKNLQILSNFMEILSNLMVDKNNGLNITKLREMSNLGGELCISNLENVVNVQDVKDASLKLKDKLERLTLMRSFGLDGSGNEMDQMNVLDYLKPPSNLNEHRIFRYGGPKFPYWIKNGSFFKMVNLRLLDCQKCTSLPRLGQLSSLKQLLISGNDGVTNVGTEFYGETCFSVDKFFPSLESLSFENMSGWEY